MCCSFYHHCIVCVGLRPQQTRENSFFNQWRVVRVGNVYSSCDNVGIVNYTTNSLKYIKTSCLHLQVYCGILLGYIQIAMVHKLASFQYFLPDHCLNVMGFWVCAWVVQWVVQCNQCETDRRPIAWAIPLTLPACGGHGTSCFSFWCPC